MTFALNEEEQALVEYLMESPKETLLVLTEEFHPGSKALLDSVQTVQRNHPNLEVIEGLFSHYERFAQTQDVCGFPAILYFKKGELAGLLLGVVDEEQIEKLGFEQ
ncbi:MAG: hypothetical protein ACFCU1_05910 [Sumerlaeia bacterium]